MAILLKNLYNQDYIDKLSTHIISYYDEFNQSDFTNAIFDNSWQDRELKQRMRHISTTLYKFLPDDYKKSINILKKAFIRFEENYGLENIIFQDFVEVYGLDDFDISMDALREFTIGSSSEFAVRVFILRYPDKTMKQLHVWATDDNHHVRRLASEGCRPRLPWAIALPEFKKYPKEVLTILDILQDDDSEYVRKSVANNLNDISKDNPQTVINITKKWIGLNQKKDKMLKHGCRTLLKSGDKESLKIFGFTPNKNIQIHDFSIPKEVKLGDNLEFSFTIKSKKELDKLRVEYAISFLRQNNKYSTKVFKISEGTYSQNPNQSQNTTHLNPSQQENTILGYINFLL